MTQTPSFALSPDSSAPRSAGVPRRGRGCVFFNYGEAYALRLIVALHSLRRVYHGPVTTILAPDDTGRSLHDTLRELDSDVVFSDELSKSWDRHRLFLDSPYETTLSFDSDLVFFEPIDPLWEPLEREGVLLTRFYPAPYGVDGTKEAPGWSNRVRFLERVRHLVDEETYKLALSRMTNDRIDINIGVMGISRPLGDGFLADWSERMERDRSRRIPLMDEMLVVALAARHRHFLAGEEWNCPADEFCRRTSLADARIIHYFADGQRVHGIRLGRNPSTWAGTKWYEAHYRAACRFPLRRLQRDDPTFTGRAGRLLAPGPGHLTGRLRREARRRCAHWWARAVRHAVKDVAFPAQQSVLALLASLGYRARLRGAGGVTVIILSYKRMANIPRIVRSSLLCGFVDRVVVSNNNPEVDLRPYLTIRDPRLELRQQPEHRGPSYRYDLARECAADYYICIDDDVFPFPWQLRRLFRSLVADPSAPRGTGGQVYDRRKAGLVELRPKAFSLRDQTRTVDVIWQIHAFTRRHLDAYFEIVENMGMENSSIHSSEDIIISFAGSGLPVLEDVGHVFKCPSGTEPGIATHNRKGFFDYRRDLYLRVSGNLPESTETRSVTRRV